MRTLAAIAALLMLCAMNASAADDRWSCLPRYPLYGVPWCWCNDDYCAKPMIFTKPECRGCCDDYCPKPMILTKPECRGSCDDYCPKPAVCPPPCCAPWPCHKACGEAMPCPCK